MPAKGKILRRDYETEELEAIRREAELLGLSEEEVIHALGRTTLDVFLNNNVFWRNIPENVWQFFIGGYQILKKWLSYREREILGRGMTSEEVREVTGKARRIAAILLLQKELDINYAAAKAAPYSWDPGTTQKP